MSTCSTLILNRENDGQSIPSFHVSGQEAFYNKSDYLETTRRDFTQHELLPTTYTWNTEHKIIRIIKWILSIIIFPIAVYQLLHRLLGKVLILPASNLNRHKIDEARSAISLHGIWKYKRITIEVNGNKIDVVIAGTPHTLSTGRIIILSNGNNACYERQLLHDHSFKRLSLALGSSVLLYNYSGVGASSGPTTRGAMMDAHRAVRAFAETEIAAHDIIEYGISIGGGVQGDASKASLKPNIQRVFVKDRTFAEIRLVADALICKPFGFLSKIFGWNIDTIESSKRLTHPEIILQTAVVESPQVLNDNSTIIDDTVIAKNASLGEVMLKQNLRTNKVFLGIPEDHNALLADTTLLANTIERALTLAY